MSKLVPPCFSDAYLCDETQYVSELVVMLRQDAGLETKVTRLAEQLVTGVRQSKAELAGMKALMHEYDLSSHEGVALMCLAEALLRIPDAATIDKLIHDKLSHADWHRHLWHTDAWLVNASTWGLLLTGKMVDWLADHPTHSLKHLFDRYGEPWLRSLLKRAMALLGEQFVMGQNMSEAWQRTHTFRNARFSFDMLGESALTTQDAQRYLHAYQHAITELRTHAGAGLFNNAGISVKLSALYPRYEYGQQEAAVDQISQHLLQLAIAAKQANINLTIDAEESDRLEMSLEIFTRVYLSNVLTGWHGLGLAVQAYQKRALSVLAYLRELSRSHGRRIPVRLVKGAYWDSEIKLAQERGLSNYPVFTSKAATDISYLVCAQYLIEHSDLFYPQFATHNARTVAHIVALAPQHQFEFQRLHGMGESLYQQLHQHHPDIACRIYAPVGSHQQLLPYLVRRLLENGANSSFVNQILQPKVPLEDLLAHPVSQLPDAQQKDKRILPLPSELFAPERQNSLGVNLADKQIRQKLLSDLSGLAHQTRHVAPIINGVQCTSENTAIYSPANRTDLLGYLTSATIDDVSNTMRQIDYRDWAEMGGAHRADVLDRAANLMEQQRTQLISLIVREAGRTIVDALNEVREAVDFCRYYAWQARQLLANPMTLKGVTGESNQLSYAPRGIFVCISPWNFPVAIFTGQVAAALVAGNAVIAKPAEVTPLCASFVVQLLHQAGVPVQALQLLVGNGSLIGRQLIAHPDVAGVAFTGSTNVAQQINLGLAQRLDIRPLIAETGGQNCMIVDSSALPEQVVKDILQSAFNSAGQRCSALRVLFVQQEIAPVIIELLSGAMDELHIGHPASLSTDIGPVISQDALDRLRQHQQRMDVEAKIIKKCTLPILDGYYFAPCVYQIDSLIQLQQEVFGPILHIIPYAENKLNRVIADINATRYGLTLGIHSRINTTIQQICQQVHCGNIYVNRNMIGAVVGTQPFGGEGLSGTGPKAGGPNYLKRFVTERVVTCNTAAVGGNVSLFRVG